LDDVERSELLMMLMTVNGLENLVSGRRFSSLPILLEWSWHLRKASAACCLQAFELIGVGKTTVKSSLIQ